MTTRSAITEVRVGKGLRSVNAVRSVTKQLSPGQRNKRRVVRPPLESSAMNAAARTDRPTALLQVLSRSDRFQIRDHAHFEGACRGTLIHATFDAHTLDIPPLEEVVLLAANAYHLKHAMFDFGWGLRDHFSSHPHPLHVFPAGHPYRWEKDGWADVTLLTLDAGGVGAMLDELGVRSGPDCLWELSGGGFANPLVYHAMESFRREAAGGSPRLLVDSFCALIVNELAQQRPSRQPRSATLRKLPAGTLARVAGHVHDHLAQDLSLDELARVAGLSRFHFLRSFKASTGSSPLQYVTERRIAQAKRLLAESDLAMPQIASCCGFASADAMARAFRRAEGVSPRGYRADAGRARPDLERWPTGRKGKRPSEEGL